MGQAAHLKGRSKLKSEFSMGCLRVRFLLLGVPLAAPGGEGLWLKVKEGWALGMAIQNHGCQSCRIPNT